MSRVLPLLIGIAVAACGCDSPQPATTEPSENVIDAGPMAVASDAATVSVDSRADAGFVLSRFGPHQGLAGTRVRLLGSSPQEFPDISVTIGGVPAIMIKNDFLIEVEVAPNTPTGPLCVSGAAWTRCGEIFTVLTGPVAYYVAPSEAVVGTGSIQAKLIGDGFTAASAVRLDGQPLTTKLVNWGELTVDIPARYLETAGTREISVFSFPPPGRARGASVTLTVKNPAPRVDHLAWAVSTSGSPEMLELHGAGFVFSSSVLIDGLPVPLHFQSPSKLTAELPAVLAAGQHLIQVQNPPPGGGTGAPVLFLVK